MNDDGCRAQHSPKVKRLLEAASVQCDCGVRRTDAEVDSIEPEMQFSGMEDAMRGWPFESIPEDRKEDTPFPLGFAIVITIFFAAIAALLLGPR